MIPSSWKTLRPHKGQSQVWRSTQRFVCLPCGRGSGKTELSRRRVVAYLSVKKEWNRPLYFYALPTYNQARRVAWDEIIDLIPKSWLAPNGVNKSNMEITTVFGSKLYIVGLDKPQRIEGNQWDGGIIDESCDQRPGVFDRSVLPALAHKNAWCWRIGVPKRYGVGAAEFKRVCELGAKGEDPDTKTWVWPASDIMPPSEIEIAKRLLDARDYNEQYNANWETIGGAIFWAFDDVLNVTNEISYTTDKPVIVGSDFNVNPMSWILCHKTADGLVVFDELFIRDTNTERTLDKLWERYSEHKGQWIFMGDATGRARKTSASESDYIQIKNDERFKDKRIFYPSANPKVVDRFASCNALFKNALGDRRLFIHPRCTQLIADLKARAWKEGSREPDDYGDIGHMTDALGYVVHLLYPISAEVEGSAEISTQIYGA